MELLLLFLLLIASAVFSGSETGVYSLSSVRLRSDSEGGDAKARIIARLLRNKTGLLITLLIANNLILELLAHRTDHLVDGLLDLPRWGIDLTVTLILTPVVFFFGELLPKDFFRRRPHQALGVVAPILGSARVLFFILAWPLEQFSRLTTWLVDPGHTPFERRGREEALEILQEGTRTGALPPEVDRLALNALRLRETPVTQVMIPWAEVTCIDDGAPETSQQEALLEARFSRLPVLAASGEVRGYVHQLEAFAKPNQAPRVRSVPFVEPSLGIDRALSQMRLSGQRLAVVGEPARPLGLVTLKNLVDAIVVDLVEDRGHEAE